MLNKKLICILDYGSGNVRSVYNVLEHLGHNAIISNSKEVIRNCSHFILPGVGSFTSAMKNIDSNIPFDQLENEVVNKGKPFLGICVGMQVLANHGYEFNKCEGFGWIPGIVNRLNVTDLPLPHVGWNDITIKKESQIFDNLKEYRDFYFVHSYAFDVENNEHVLASSNYGKEFNSIICKDNIYGFQFHPEKSQRAGQLMLNNFIKII